MHSAMLFIQKPANIDKEISAQRNWSGFLGDIEVLASMQTDTERLAENCWLIPLGSGASLLSGLISRARSRMLGHRVLFFEKTPDWVQGDWGE
jgi:hypothetical protein